MQLHMAPLIERAAELRGRLTRRWRQLDRRRRLAVIGIPLGIVVVLLAMSGSDADDGRRHWQRDQILDAIRAVESGGRANPPDGDDGLAIGPYQIHEVYWIDAHAFDPAIGGDYQRCRERRYAERVIDAYMRHWVPDAWAAGDAEVIARTHNGGPAGAARAATVGYWRKVRAALLDQRR